MTPAEAPSLVEPLDLRSAAIRTPDSETSIPSNGAATPSNGARSVAIVGAGGHGREIADIVRAVANESGMLSLLGIVDDGDPDLGLLARSGIRFLGTSQAISDRSLDVLIGVGDPRIRARLADRYPRPGKAIIHPSASVGSNSRLDDGSVLAQGVIVTTNVQIGRHTHVNVASSISHDCVLGDFVTVCPGVRLTGAVRVGDGAFLGAGATVLPGIRIGRNAVVGAGAVVTSDVSSGRTVAGVPARRI